MNVRASTMQRDAANLLATLNCNRTAHSDSQNEKKCTVKRLCTQNMSKCTCIDALAAASSSHSGGCDSRHFMTAIGHAAKSVRNATG